jgi:hypothetical protein
VLFVSQVETHASIRAFFPPGTLSPMHASGIGKALLAQMPPEARARALAAGGLERFTDRTLTDVAAIEADMARTRVRGYAIDDEEKTEGMRCIAAPVMDLHGEVVAGISVSGPSSRVSEAETPRLAAAVTGAAATLSAALGERRDDLAQHTAVGVNIAAAHLQQVVERPGDHVALLDLGHLASTALLKALSAVFAGIRQGAPRRSSHGRGPASPDRGWRGSRWIYPAASSFRTRAWQGVLDRPIRRASSVIAMRPSPARMARILRS